MQMEKGEKLTKTFEEKVDEEEVAGYDGRRRMFWTKKTGEMYNFLFLIL